MFSLQIARSFLHVHIFSHKHQYLMSVLFFRNACEDNIFLSSLSLLFRAQIYLLFSFLSPCVLSRRDGEKVIGACLAARVLERAVVYTEITTVSLVSAMKEAGWKKGEGRKKEGRKDRLGGALSEALQAERENCATIAEVRNLETIHRC